ncbi:hypothetical protein QOT17_009171 [Balamuthia mandrillaris]
MSFQRRRRGATETLEQGMEGTLENEAPASGGIESIQTLKVELEACRKENGELKVAIEELRTRLNGVEALLGLVHIKSERRWEKLRELSRRGAQFQGDVHQAFVSLEEEHSPVPPSSTLATDSPSTNRLRNSHKQRRGAFPKWLELPPEVMLNIFCMLKGKDLATVRLTCPQWAAVGRDDTLWLLLYERKWFNDARAGEEEEDEVFESMKRERGKHQRKRRKELHEAVEWASERSCLDTYILHRLEAIDRKREEGRTTTKLKTSKSKSKTKNPSSSPSSPSWMDRFSLTSTLMKNWKNGKAALLCEQLSPAKKGIVCVDCCFETEQLVAGLSSGGVAYWDLALPLPTSNDIATRTAPTTFHASSGSKEVRDLKIRGSRCVCCDFAGVVSLWNLNTFEMLNKLTVPAGVGVYTVELHDESELVAVGSLYKALLINFSREPAEVVGELSQDAAWVTSLQIKGSTAVTLNWLCAGGHWITAWDLSTEQQTRTYKDVDRATQVRYDGVSIIAASSLDKNVYVWDIRQKDCRSALSMKHDSGVERLDMNAFHVPNGWRFASGTHRSEVVLWDLRKARQPLATTSMMESKEEGQEEQELRRGASSSPSPSFGFFRERPQSKEFRVHRRSKLLVTSNEAQRRSKNKKKVLGLSTNAWKLMSADEKGWQIVDFAPNSAG